MIQVKCSRCGREKELSPKALARNPACIYCGQPLNVDPRLLASVQPATFANSIRGHKPATRVVCPICERIINAGVSPAGKCIACGYCKSSAIVLDDQGAACPGQNPAHRLNPPPENYRELIENVRQGLNIGHFVPPAEERLLSAINILISRYIRGHASLEEGRAILTMIRNVVRMTERDWSSNSSPLPPAVTADLLINALPRDLFFHATPNREDGITLRITTDRWTDGLGALEGFARAALETLATSRHWYASTAAFEDPGDNEIRHNLVLTIVPAGEGSAIGADSMLSTGEMKKISPRQQELIDAIPLMLSKNARELLFFKTIFGLWFNMYSMASLTPQALQNWLKQF